MGGCKINSEYSQGPFGVAGWREVSGQWFAMVGLSKNNGYVCPYQKKW